MKKIFLLTALTAALFSCNNREDSHTVTTKADEHAGHDIAPDTTMNAGMDAVSATMANMMREMHMTKPTGNNDVDFAAMMMAHHKGAVEMSKVAIAQGSNAEIKDFAQKVIDDQNKEISFMQEFIAGAPATASPDAADFQKALNESMMAMMNDSSAVQNNIDKDFAAQMIPHHQSAVDMANAYLKYGKEPKLVTLCKNIVGSQTKEISWLKDWLNKNKG